jgi:hypothetical protein
MTSWRDSATLPLMSPLGVSGAWGYPPVRDQGSMVKRNVFVSPFTAALMVT